MILKSLTLENFRSHENTQLSFHKGITTIIGPNGSGKSSIFEAISFALYGTSEYKIEDLIRRGGERFKVELVFELGGNTYKVVRSRGKRSPENNINELYINGEFDGKTSKGINKKIEEILGIKRDVFLNAIYIKQGEIDNLINIRPAERKKIVGELLGIDRFEKVWREMGEAISEFRNRLEYIRGQLLRKETVEKNIEEIKREIREGELELEKLEREYKKIESDYKEKKKILEEYDKKEKRYRELNDKIRDIDNSIIMVENEKKDLKEDLKNIRALMETLENTEENYRRYCEIDGELKKISSEVKKYRNYYDSYKSLIGIKRELEENIGNITKKIREEGVEGIQLKDVEEKIEGIEERLRQLEDVWKKLFELESLNSKLDEIERYREELERCKEGYLEYMEIESKLRDLNNKVVDLERLKVKRENIKSRMEELKREISKLKKELAPLKEIEERVKKEEEWRRRLEEYNKKFQMLNRKIAEKETKIKELEEIIEKLSKAGNKCPLCQSHIEDTKKESLLRKYREDLAGIKKELEKLYRDRDKCKGEIYKLEKLLQEVGNLKNKYGRLKEKEKNLQNKYRELEEYVEELQIVESEIGKYREVEVEMKKLIEKKEKLEEIYDRYLGCKNFLENTDREELLKRRGELLKTVGDYSKEGVNRERKDLGDKLKRWNDIKKLMLDKEDKEKRLKEILNEIEDIKKYVDLYEDLERSKASLESEIKKYREDYDKYMKTHAVLENYSKKYKVGISNLINTLEKRIREIEEKLTILRSERERYLRDIESLKYSEEDHRRMEEIVEETYNRLVSRKNEIGKYKARLDALKENLENLLKELKELEEKEKEKEKLERYIKYLEDIRNQVFSRDGFQQYLRKRYIPLIQRYTNEIFSEFELPYHHIQIKEDYDILVDGFPVKNLSGGEQIAVSLALRLGIAKALCNNLQFIVLDEPTAFLDEDRRKKLLKIFGSIKTISQIFIISHHQELEQIADNVIYVTKRGGISKVKLLDNSG